MAIRKLANTIDDEQVIRSLVETAIAYIKAGDFDSYFALFAEDAIWMLPSDYNDVGRTEARSFYRFTEKFRFEQEMTINEIAVSGDLAFARISMQGFLRPKDDPNGTPLRSVSRHIWLFEHKKEGGWKISRDIWNNPRLPAAADS